MFVESFSMRKRRKKKRKWIECIQRFFLFFVKQTLCRCRALRIDEEMRNWKFTWMMNNGWGINNNLSAFELKIRELCFYKLLTYFFELWHAALSYKSINQVEPVQSLWDKIYKTCKAQKTNHTQTCEGTFHKLRHKFFVNRLIFI